MSNFAVIYDSCVLYPAPLRDLLMHLALTDMYRAKWTNQIHEEWISNLLKNRQDLDRTFLERTKDRMNTAVRDSLVDGYEYLIPNLNLPDANDRHILAAAIHSKCSVIVTYNLRDFPKKDISQYEIEAQHPDEFILNLLDLSPELVYQAMNRHRLILKNPPKTVEEYLATLLKQELNKTINHLKQVSDLI